MAVINTFRRRTIACRQDTHTHTIRVSGADDQLVHTSRMHGMGFWNSAQSQRKPHTRVRCMSSVESSDCVKRCTSFNVAGAADADADADAADGAVEKARREAAAMLAAAGWSRSSAGDGGSKCRAICAQRSIVKK